MTLLTSNSRNQMHFLPSVESGMPSACGTLFFMRNLMPTNFVPQNSHLVFVKLLAKGQTIDKIRVPEKGLYKCKCGNFYEGLTNNVKRGKTLSCGCWNREVSKARSYTHGFSEHPLYTVWENMLSRCYNEKVLSYPNYGGRGVKMCDEWYNRPDKFVEWALKNGWRKGLQLDKDIKAKELGIESVLYSPEMCQFVSPKVNANNKSDNTLITYKNKTQTLAQWADEKGIKQSTLCMRFSYGWSIEDALDKPVKK